MSKGYCERPRLVAWPESERTAWPSPVEGMRSRISSRRSVSVKARYQARDWDSFTRPGGDTPASSDNLITLSNDAAFYIACAAAFVVGIGARRTKVTGAAADSI